MNCKPAILIMSCDHYSDAWPPFFQLFERYWPNCPYDIYLASENKGYEANGVNVLKLGKLPWTTMLIDALDQIENDLIILLQEDYLLSKPVLSDKIEAYCELFRNDAIAAIKLYPLPAPDAESSIHPELGQLKHGHLHRVTTQAAIWKKSFLYEVANAGEDARQFEIKGSKQAEKDDRLFLSVRKTNFGRLDGGHYPYSYTQSTGIVRGKWAHEMKTMQVKENLNLDTDTRPFEAARSAWLRKSPMYIQRPLTSLLIRLRLKEILFPS